MGKRVSNSLLWISTSDISDGICTTIPNTLPTSFMSVTRIEKQHLSISASQLFAVANSPQNPCGEHMLLSGSSGIGKSYLAAYFIWRLFYPDGVEVTAVPDMIAWRSESGSSGGWVYQRGYFNECIP